MTSASFVIFKKIIKLTKSIKLLNRSFIQSLKSDSFFLYIDFKSIIAPSFFISELISLIPFFFILFMWHRNNNYIIKFFYLT